MGRLKARMAKEGVDRALHAHLARATRELQSALGACREANRPAELMRSRLDGVMRDLGTAIGEYQGAGSPAELVHAHLDRAMRELGLAAGTCRGAGHSAESAPGDTSTRRARTCERTIRGALASLGGIGSIVPNIDWDDPDMTPEPIRAETRRTAEATRAPAAAGATNEAE